MARARDSIGESADPPGQPPAVEMPAAGPPSRTTPETPAATVDASFFHASFRDASFHHVSARRRRPKPFDVVARREGRTDRSIRAAAKNARVRAARPETANAGQRRPERHGRSTIGSIIASSSERRSSGRLSTGREVAHHPAARGRRDRDRDDARDPSIGTVPDRGSRAASADDLRRGRDARCTLRSTTPTKAPHASRVIDRPALARFGNGRRRREDHRNPASTKS